MVWIAGIGITLILLFTFPRQMGIVFVSLVGIAAAVGGYFYFVEQTNIKKKSLISINATYDKTQCTDPNYPLSLVVHNGSTEVLNRLSLEVTANRVGYSDSVFFDYFTSDKIMQPNEYYSSCWSLDDYKMKALQFLPSALTWKAKVSSVTWQDD
jgi:hypothetical protein